MGLAPDPIAAPAGVARRVEELYTSHARLVRSICRSLLRDRNEVEDAVQQTFLSAQRALANGSTPREPAAWLATIARNECLARVRERMGEPLPVDAEPTEFGADAHSAAVSRYEVATLRGALADLPRAQREAILLRELRGLSYDEVARALSVTTGAVESLIFRARRTLQGKLSEALSVLSPVALFGRMFGAGGGDELAGPVVAKVAAIGVGATLLAGGAAVGPHALGLGPGAPKVHHAAPRAHVPPSQRLVPNMPVRNISLPAPVVAHHAERDVSLTEKSSSDTAEGSRSETSSADTSGTEKSSTDSSSKETANNESETATPAPPAVSPPPATTPPPDTGGSDPVEPGDSGD